MSDASPSPPAAPSPDGARARRFEGLVALVSGGTGGIGRATAARLGAEGARVVVLGRDAARAEAVAAGLGLAAGAALGLGCDVADEAQVARAGAALLARFGRLDVVVNNAGTMTFKPFEAFTGQDWRHVLDVDLMGAVHLTRLAFRHMPAGGAVVNVSSVHAERTTPHVAPYAAAKAALLALTRSAAIEGAPRGIRVNAVLPGAIDTPMLWDNPNVKAGIEAIDPAAVGSPDAVAAAIAFLAAPEAGFVQGATLAVDGGRLARL